MEKGYEDLLGFIPILKNDDFGNWFIDQENDGTLEHPIQMPYVRYSECVRKLECAIYQFNDNNPEMDLNHYIDILKKNGIEWERESMEEADVSKMDAAAIMALLLGAVRAERFCDGALLGFLKSGAMLRWLEALKEIVE